MKKYFQRALGANPGRLHVAAHSHHLWPDVSYEAQEEAWNDAARLADRKWERIFGHVWPSAQRHVARILRLSSESSLTFSSSTHDFLVRILSCLPWPTHVPHVLTTDAEFHSAARQFARLEEEGLVTLTRVPMEPFATFHERWSRAATEGGPHDLVFLSHVAFGSGFTCSLERALAPFTGSENPLVVVDGYHSFCAIPVDFSPFEKRAFFVAGGYKYAMSGEGACFLHAPPGFAARPRMTGWFASFGALASAGAAAQVPYGSDGSRFLGSTFDPTALYRMSAVLTWMETAGISVERMAAHRLALSTRFAAGLPTSGLLPPAKLLFAPHAPERAAFLTFEFEAPEVAQAAYNRLLAENVVTDVRGKRLRVCFSIYHDESDVDALVRVCDRA